MIGYLRGRLRYLETEQVVVDVAGVGYAVRIPLSTYYELDRLGEGAEAELLVHTEVRETSLELFGFVTAAERALFEKLLGVSGIGPRLAQAVLSGMAPAEFLDALAIGDVVRLTRIPGVGKKTAERLVLELRDKVQGLRASAGETTPSQPSEDADLVQALTGLGYRPADAERALGQVRFENADAPFSEALRLCLRRLAKV